MATTYMNLSLPTVSVTPGPGWATQLNTAFEAIDAHDHSSGKGTKVTPSGLNINSDLSMGSNDLTNVRSVRYINNSGSLGGAADENAVYVYGGNLYFNNDDGTAVKITDAGTLNAAGLVGAREQVLVAGTHTILPSDTYITLRVNTTGARTINLPSAGGVSAGRYYIIQDISGQSETNAITLVRDGSDTIDGAGANFSLEIDNGVWEIESDGASNWKVTRAMPDFLTKSSLTLGSTVLNTSTLTVAGNTLNATALTAVGYLSLGSTVAATGQIRLPNDTHIKARNAGNSDDVSLLYLDSSNDIFIGRTAAASKPGSWPASSLIIQRDVLIDAGKQLRVEGNLTLGDDTTAVSDSGIIRGASNLSIYGRKVDNTGNTLVIGLVGNDDIIYMGSGPRYTPTRNYAVLQRVPQGDFGYNHTGTWTISGYAGLLAAVNTATTGARRDFWIVDIPDGATLDSVTMYYNPGGSSRTPATRLGIYLYRVPNDGALISPSDSDSLISTSSMASATPAQVAAYSFPAGYTSHTFTCNQANTIDKGTYMYVISIVSESGSGADGTVNSVRGFRFSYTLSTIGRV